MSQEIKENNKDILDNFDDNLSSISINSQENDDDDKCSYKDMSYLNNLTDIDEEINNTFQKSTNNNNLLTINDPYLNINNNYLSNTFNNFNLIQYQQQLNALIYNYQWLLLNNKIKEYKFNLFMNALMNNQLNINNNLFCKNRKIKKNNGEKNVNIHRNTKKPPKPENEIKIEEILSGAEKRTLVKLGPIPNKYSPFDMIVLLDKHLKTEKGKRIYNSLYVPLAKVIGKNKGYCFINLVSPKYVIKFYNIFNGLNFNLKNCKKKCSVVFSDKQNPDCSNVDALKRPITFTDTVKN